MATLPSFQSSNLSIEPCRVDNRVCMMQETDVKTCDHGTPLNSSSNIYGGGGDTNNFETEEFYANNGNVKKTSI